jgi:multiple sugar transport system permease protein
MSKSDDDAPVGMQFLESLPQRWITLYLPMGVFLFVLLFPFYCMVVTSVNPNA